MSPQKIDRYEIKAELGRGGMATVYLASDPRFQRDVAIKVLPRAYLNDEMFRARFQREAHTIATLEHPAIVPVHDFGEEDGQPYLVMRYMSGGSLQERLQKGPLSPAAALKIVRRISAALDQAHRQGIIHRDLKPGNILFDRYDNAFLSDFGIVKLSKATASLTGDSMLGTPAYMSPEQVQGADALDGRSDIYALGAILFAMLSGRPPYQADTPMGVALKHITDPVPSLLTQKPNLPPSLENVIQKAMAKEPANRFATASDLTATLAQAIDSADAAPAPTWRRAPADARTVVEPRPEAGGAREETAAPPQASRTIPAWLWALGGLFVGGCLIGAVAAAIVAPSILNGGFLPIGLAPAARSTPTSTATTSADVAAGAGAETVEETATSSATPPATAEDVPTATTTATATVTPSVTPTPSATPTSTPAIRNGPIVFDSAEEEGFEIYIMEPDGSNLTRLTENSVRDDEADLSPDAQFIAFERQLGSDWMIMIMESDGDNERELVPGRQPDWSPDGRSIAYETFTVPQQIAFVDVATENVRQLTNTRNNSRAPSWSPDGDEIVFMTEVDNSWQLAILDVDSGRQRQITSGGLNKRFPVWSPDGDLIAYNTLDANGAPDHIWVIEPSGENATRLTSEGQNGRPAWSPDGQYLLFNSNRSERWLIYRMERDGANQVPLTSIGDDQRPDWGRR